MPRKFLYIFSVAFFYFISGAIGLLLAIPGTNVSPIWPPSGIALAAVILYGYPMLFGVFLGSFFLNFVTLLEILPFWSTLHVFIVSIVIGIGAALQAGLGAFLIDIFLKGPWDDRYARAGSMLKFLVIVLLSCLVNSTIGTFAITIHGYLPLDLYWLVWWNWWIGDSGGVFLMTPLIVSLVRYPVQNWSFRRVLEAILILAMIICTMLLNRRDPHFAYVYVCLMIWAAIRFQLAGASVALSFTLLVVLIETMYNRGPFIAHTLNQSLLHLDIFIIVTSPTVLAVAAYFNEPQKTERE